VGTEDFLRKFRELETARLEKALAVNLVFRDNGVGGIRWKQMARFGQSLGTGTENLEFLGLARAFLARDYRVEPAPDLSAVIFETRSLSAPSMVDVPVEYGD
jgi:acetolactate synthase I/II/III large subunit